MLGRPIDAKPGRPVAIRCDQGIRVDGDGRVFADTDGVLQLMNNTLKVTQIIEVPEYVDFSTGNIDTVGSVHVRKGVRDNFTVKATGDIRVDGLVESATLACEGNLALFRGMAVKESGGIAVGGDVVAGYLNDVRGVIQGSLTIHKELMNCDLDIGGDLDAAGASIIGGSVRATGTVSVRSLGSEVYVPTTLVLGSLPILASELRVLKQTLRRVEEAMEADQAEYATLQQIARSLNPAQKERLTELQFIFSEHEQTKNSTEFRIAQIEEEMRASRKVDLIINKVIYPRVRLETDEYHVVFSEEIAGPVRIGWSQSRDLLISRSGKPPRELRTVAQVRPAA